MTASQTNSVAEVHPLDELQLRPRAFGFHFADSPEKQVLLDGDTSIAAAIGSYATHEAHRQTAYGMSRTLIDIHDQSVHDSLLDAYDQLVEPLRQGEALSPALRKFSNIALNEALPHLRAHERSLLGGIALVPGVGAGLFVSRNLQLEVSAAAGNFVAQRNSMMVCTKEQREIADEIAIKSYQTERIAQVTSRILPYMIATCLPPRSQLGIEPTPTSLSATPLTVIPAVRSSVPIAA